jgi:hypothetical protein
MKNDFEKFNNSIETKYDEETQKLIDFYKKQIEQITEEYNNKFKSASELNFYEIHKRDIKEEYRARIKPYQDQLLNIYLTAKATYIVKKEDDNI